MVIRIACCAITALSLTCSGCTTHRFLRSNVNKHTGTLTRILYEQVLDNLAASATNPDVMPYFAIIGDGTTQATDQGNATGGLRFSPFGLTEESLTGTGQRALQENWKLQPVMSPGRLLRLRCAFQFVLHPPTLESYEELSPEGNGQHFVVACSDSCFNCVEEFARMGLLPAPAAFNGISKEGRLVFKSAAQAEAYAEQFRHDLGCNFPTGWYCLEKCYFVGPSACYVGQHGRLYAWVPDAGVDSLTRFTATVLALASTDPPPPPSAPRITIRKIFREENVITEATGEIKGNIESYTPDAKATIQSFSPQPEPTISPFDRPGFMPFSGARPGIEVGPPAISP